MNVFKFAAAELKKIFLRPVIYFVPVILALLIILTTQTYQPEARPGNANIVSGFTATTVENLKIDFTASELEENTNKLVTKIDEILKFYRDNETQKKIEADSNAPNPNILSIKTIYDPRVYALSATRITPMSEISLDLDILVNAMKVSSSSIPTQALDALGRLGTKVINFKDKLSKLMDTKTSPNSHQVPVVIASNSTINKLYLGDRSNLSLVEQFKILIEESKRPSANQFNIVKINADKMKDIFNEMKSEISKIEDISFTKEFLDELKAYPEALNTRQGLQYAKINTSTTFNGCKEAILNYSYNIDIMENIFASKLYLNVLSAKSDEEIFNLYKLNTNIYASTPASSLYKYGINEDLAKFMYLWNNWENGVSLSNVNNNFSLSYTMGETATALDYSFYSMEFISFFIILITAILAASIVAGEYPGGTLKMIAIRPYSRRQILTGKFLAAIFFSIIFIVFSAAVTTIVGLMFGPLNVSTNVLMILNGQWVTLIPSGLMFVIYLVSVFLKTLMFAAIAIFISVLFKSNLPAVLISIVSNILGIIIITFFGVNPALTYIPFTNSDLFKFTGGQFISTTDATISAFTTPVLLNNSIYITGLLIAATTALFLILAQVIFKKRDIQ